MNTVYKTCGLKRYKWCHIGNSKLRGVAISYCIAKQKRAPQGVLFFTRTAPDRVSGRNFIEEVYIIIIRVQVLKE